MLYSFLSVSPAMKTEEALRSVASSRYNPPTPANNIPNPMDTIPASAAMGMEEMTGAGAGAGAVVASSAAATDITTTAATAAVVTTAMSLSAARTTGARVEGGLAGSTSWLDEVGPDGRRRRRSKKQVGQPPTKLFILFYPAVYTRYHIVLDTPH